MRVYLLSTAVAPLGSGLGGGVERMVVDAARQLDALGYAVRVIAPLGSRAEVPELRVLPGALAPTAIDRGYDEPLPDDAGDTFLRAALRDLASRVRPEDAILNFSYDRLPLRASESLPCPLGTLLSMGSLNRALDREICRIADRHPERLAFLSAAQAASFGVPAPVRLIPPGLDFARYRFNARPGRACCWLGRIAPEKGLDDVFAGTARAGHAVTVFGLMQDRAYWEALNERYPGVPVGYGGFLAMPALAEVLGAFRVALMTPKWLEAFGIVGIEALACGTPVVAYRRGGVGDYVLDGETGWLVEPDDIDGLCAAVGRVELIDRARCRTLVESRYTLHRYGSALADWLGALVSGSANPKGTTA